MEEKALRIIAYAFFMRKSTSSFFLILFSAIAFGWLRYSKTDRRITVYHAPVTGTTNKIVPKEILKLRLKAFTAKTFVKENHFDTLFCFLVDMSLPANHTRFFIYDFKRDTIQNAGLVAHGNCNRYWLEGRKYGNEIGCGCTSLGKYKIGSSYYGRFGLAFKLYGLDKTNSNAFKRYVVLHSHSCIPETEVDEEVCQSNGCPMVSPHFLKQLELIIKHATRLVLLWILE
jgi:hypothetical protein